MNRDTRHRSVNGLRATGQNRPSDSPSAVWIDSYQGRQDFGPVALIAVAVILVLAGILFVELVTLPGTPFSYSLFSLFLVPAIFVFLMAVSMNPTIMAYAYVLAMVFSPRISVGTAGNRSFDLRVEDFVFVVMFFWLLGTANSQSTKWSVKKPIYIYLCIATISTVLGLLRDSIPLSRAGLFLLRDFEYILVLFVVANLFTTKEAIGRFFRFAMMISVVVPLYAIWQVMKGEWYPVFPLDLSGRPQIGGFCLAFAIAGLAGWIETAGKRSRLLFLLAVSAHAAGIVAVASRTYFIALVLAITYTFYLAFRHRFTTATRLNTVVIVVFTAVAIGYAVPRTFLGDRLGPLWDAFIQEGPTQAVNLDARARMISLWLKEGSEHFLLGGGKGWGPGGRVSFSTYPVADCGWARVFGEMGILGMCAFMWVLWCIRRDAESVLRERPEYSTEHCLATMVSTMVVAFAVAAFATEPFYATKSAESFWMLTGLLYAAAHLAEEHRDGTGSIDLLKRME